MLFAALLLLCPFPQTGNVARAVVDRLVSADSASEDTRVAAVANSTTSSTSSSQISRSSSDSSFSQPLPSMPVPKVTTDAAALAAAEASPDSLSSASSFPVEPVKPAATGSYETSRERKLWYALSFAGHGAAGLDAWTTRRAITQGYGTEANPLLRPFAHSNLLYAATQVSPAVLDFVGHHMMTSRHPLLRRVWWLPQSAGTAVSLFAGAHNLSVAP